MPEVFGDMMCLFLLKVPRLKDTPGIKYFGLGDLLSLAGIQPPWGVFLYLLR